MRHADIFGRELGTGQPVCVPGEGRTGRVWALGRSITGQSVVMIDHGGDQALSRQLSGAVVGIRRVRS